jgi:hypothetical protein
MCSARMCNNVLHVGSAQDFYVFLCNSGTRGSSMMKSGLGHMTTN